MSKGSVAESIEKLITPILQQNRLELVEVEYKKEGPHWVLRVYIDKAGGVTVDDCSRLSHQIEDLIEVEEIVSSSFTLEVSSPGLDRPLKTERDFLRFQGKQVHVTTFTPIQQQKNFKGTILDFKDQTLILETGGRQVEIPSGQIARARLEIEI